MNKVFSIFLVWAVISLMYVILAITMPTIQSFSDSTAATINTSSNMSNYPGSLETVRAFPLFAWFIPGGVGIAGTVYFLRKDD